jgi:ornithine cyclodeaminase
VAATLLVISRAEVDALLDLDALIEAVGAAMADLSAGRASMPPRTAATLPEGAGLLGVMPASLPSARTLSAKLVTLFPGNAALGLDTHQALIAVFDPATGTPAALMDGTAITALRTAAGSALATRLLARPEGSVLAILGTGVQARSHARLLRRVMEVEDLRIAGRDQTKAAALAEELVAEAGLPARAVPTYADALGGADVVCATTHSPEPVVRRAWLSPGTHVNSVGLHPEGREVDAETVVDALVVIESRGSALGAFPAGANDLAWPIRDGLMTAEDVHAEIGEVVAGLRPGRTTPEQITLYKSVGVAVQDAAAAGLVLAAARAAGAGVEVDV